MVPKVFTLSSTSFRRVSFICLNDDDDDDIFMCRPEEKVEYLLKSSEFGLALAVITMRNVDMSDFDGASHRDWDNDYHNLRQYMKDNYDLWRQSSEYNCRLCRNMQDDEDSEASDEGGEEEAEEEDEAEEEEAEEEAEPKSDSETEVENE
jgi:hypothetical protein